MITYYMMEGAKTGVIDAREVAPKHADERSASVGSALSTSSIGVPGELRGLYTLHRKHGVLDWALLVGFAVKMANATTVSPVLANRLKEASEDIIASDDLRKVFAREKVDKNDTKDDDDDYAVNQMDAVGHLPILPDAVRICPQSTDTSCTALVLRITKYSGSGTPCRTLP